MGDLPHPPKLKLTPHQRAFLAGELYPPEEPYKQPPRLDEETRQRNLKGIADARAALHATKPYEEGTEGQDFRKSSKRNKERYEQRMAEREAALAEEEMRDFETGRHHPDRRPVEPFDEEEQKSLAESTEEDAVVWRSGNANPDLVTIEGLEDLEWEEVKEAKPLYDEGVAGQWFYDVKPSPVDYFKAGTHGQEMGPIYSNYGATGFAQPAVSTPKQAGPPPPGATAKRPVEDKPPTLSSRSYFSSGTQGQPMPRDRSDRDRTGEVEKRRARRRGPRTDKTTPYDTMTREELMRYREEEAQRMRDEK